jgi:hypothetical protein
MTKKKPWYKSKRILAAIGSALTAIAYCANNDFLNAARVISQILGGE